MSTITASWTLAGNSMTEIRINGTRLWQGTSLSGSTVDISNYSANTAWEVIDKFKYSSDMSGSSFTINFNMTDESSKTIVINNPPDG